MHGALERKPSDVVAPDTKRGVFIMARKSKSRSKKIIGIIAAVFMLLIVAGTGIFLFVEESGFGASTLSLSEADLRSDIEFFNGKAFILTFTQGRLGQYYEGVFSPDDISDKLKGDTKTGNGFKLTVEYEDQNCIYRIKKDENTPRIQTVDVIEWEETSIYSTFRDCEEQAPGKAEGKEIVRAGIYESWLPWSDDICYAVVKTTGHPVGFLENPDLQVKSVLSLDIDDEAKETLNIDSLDKTQGYLGDIAYGVWQGNLNTGLQCDSQSPYLAAYVDGKWRVISSSKYVEYKSRFGGLEEEANEPLTLDHDEAYKIRDKYNSYAEDALRSISFGRMENEGKLDSGRVVKVAKDPVAQPVITLYIKADKLGIVTPRPLPKIVSTDSECFRTGEYGSISVTVKNTGKEGGPITVRGECQSPFKIRNSVEKYVEAGKTAVFNLEIGADVSTKTLAACVVKAETAEKASEGGSTPPSTVEACADPQRECTPNTYSCTTEKGLNVIKKCSSEGVYSIYKRCGEGEYCDLSGKTPECRDKDESPANQDDDECGMFDFGCKLKKEYGYLVMVLLAVATGLTAMGGVMASLGRFRGMPLPIKVIVGLLAGAAVAALVYVLFLLAVILAVAAIIIWLVVKNQKKGGKK